MEFENKEIRALAERIYDLDGEVYWTLGSSLGRVFNGSREQCIHEIMEMLYDSRNTEKIQSHLALISNMARTIKNKDNRKKIMTEYDAVFQQVEAMILKNGENEDILDPKIADLNQLNLGERFGEKDHIIICIGRSYGSGGNEIGFKLADDLKMNFYDFSVVNEVLKRREDGSIPDTISAYSRKKKSPVGRIREFLQYHGMSQQEVQFMDGSRFLIEKAKEEDFVVMGRYADAVLTNNHIPHISIFITAPERRRIKRIMGLNEGMKLSQAQGLVEKEDREHRKRYHFFTNRKWSDASNYDLCLNSASFGIDGSVDMILRMMNMHKRH